MESQSDTLRQIKQERGALQQQRDAACDQLECVICNDHDRDTVFLPCTHACACRNCAAELKACPVCRKAIEQMVPFLMS